MALCRIPCRHAARVPASVVDPGHIPVYDGVPQPRSFQFVSPLTSFKKISITTLLQCKHSEQTT